MGYWEKWQSARDGLWYWHLRAGNHEIVAHGEGYTTEQGCDRGIAAVEQILGARNTHLKLVQISDPNA